VNLYRFADCLGDMPCSIIDVLFCLTYKATTYEATTYKAMHAPPPPNDNDVVVRRIYWVIANAMNRCE